MLQDYISQHFYPCDQTVLAGLGQMYQTDNRFSSFIDKVGGAGTATFSQKLFVFIVNKLKPSLRDFGFFHAIVTFMSLFL